MTEHRSTGSLNHHRRVVKEGFWSKLTRSLSYLPYADKLAAAYFCAMDPATPLKARATLFGALAYFILPTDLIPDALLGLGFTDDMAVLVAAFTTIRRHMTKEHLDKGVSAVRRMRQGKAHAA